MTRSVAAGLLAARSRCAARASLECGPRRSRGAALDDGLRSGQAGFLVPEIPCASRPTVLPSPKSNFQELP